MKYVSLPVKIIALLCAAWVFIAALQGFAGMSGSGFRAFGGSEARDRLEAFQRASYADDEFIRAEYWMSAMLPESYTFLLEDEAEVAELVHAARKIRVGGTYLVTTTCPSFHSLMLTAKDGTEYSLTFESGDLSAGSNSRYQLNNDEEFWDLVDRYAKPESEWSDETGVPEETTPEMTEVPATPTPELP